MIVILTQLLITLEYNCAMSQQVPAVTEEVEQFFAAFPPVSFQPNHVLIHSEQEPPGVFYLQKGQIMQVAILVNGDRLTVNYYDTTSFLPMIWAFGHHHPQPIFNRHEFITVGEVMGRWAPVDQVMAWLHEHPDVLFDLTRRLSRGFDVTLAKWEEAHQSPATILVGKVLLRHAHRFGLVQPDGQVVVKLTHQDIADQAGVTRETASRILSEFMESKLITTGYRKIYIADPAKLDTWLAKQIRAA